VNAPAELPTLAKPQPPSEDLFARLARKSSSFDLFQAMRRIEQAFPDKPRLGDGMRPVDEPFRFAQEPSLIFAPAPVAAFERPESGALPRLVQRVFGFLGPNGALPIHLTEYARERMRAHNDPTFVRFLDLLHHRFTLLFYRAWVGTQSAASLDRPGDDAFSRYAASLVHLGEPTLRDRDAVPDHAKLHVAGHLVRETRNAEGLEKILENFFRASVRVEQWIAHWLALAPEQQTRLGFGRDAERIGVGSVVGARVPDVQSRFRIRLGPLSLADYESHLPGGKPFGQMLAWLRTYIGFELCWDVRLVLRRDEVPRAALGSSARLGWTTWMGARPNPGDADDLVLIHETIAARLQVSAA
jgi:type VI secretion system protein ImpH